MAESKYQFEIQTSCSNSCNLFVRLDDPLFKQLFDTYLEFQSHFFEYEPQYYHFNILEEHVITIDSDSEDENDHLKAIVSSLLPEESQLIVQADNCPKIYSLFQNNDSIIFVVSSSTPRDQVGPLSSSVSPARTVQTIDSNDNMRTIYEDFKRSPFGFELTLNFENELMADFVSFLTYSPDHENHAHHFLENWVKTRYNLSADQSKTKEVTIKIAKIFDTLDSIYQRSSVLRQTPSLSIRQNASFQSRDIINACRVWMEIEPHEALLVNKQFKKDSIALTISALESIFERSFISIQDHCKKTDMIKYNCESFAGDCTNELISLGKRFSVFEFQRQSTRANAKVSVISWSTIAVIPMT